MKPIKPVKISKGAFFSCRLTIAVLVWLSFVLKSHQLLLLTAVLLLISAIKRVKDSPIVFLYERTLDKIIRTEETYVDENGIYFAHVFGFIVVAIGLFMIHIDFKYAWWFVFLIAILKTSGAFGYCSALKLYSCMSSDNCCRVSKAILKRGKHVR